MVSRLDSKGAKDACKSDRSRQELSNECVLAKIREGPNVVACLLVCFDISENEPSKCCQELDSKIQLDRLS